VRILAVADEVDELLTPDAIGRMRPELVLSCGDLSVDYLEYLVTVAAVPLLFVPGNHDGALGRPRERARSSVGVILPDAGGLAVGGAWGRPQEDPPLDPGGCTNVDGRIVEVKGLRVAGLGGSNRYAPGPNQYTQAEMRRRCRRLEARARLRRRLHGRRLDVLLTHAPPLGVGDDDDPCHVGFAAFHRLARTLRPGLLVHGHIHPHGRSLPDRWLDGVRVVNVVPSKVLDLDLDLGVGPV
jgi:hypothetical protein